MKTSVCKGCGKPIVWATNPQSGKKVPITLVPTYLVYDIGDQETECIINVPNDVDDRLGINHFLVCPKANDFHRGGAR